MSAIFRNQTFKKLKKEFEGKLERTLKREEIELLKWVSEKHENDKINEER